MKKMFLVPVSVAFLAFVGCKKSENNTTVVPVYLNNNAGNTWTYELAETESGSTTTNNYTLTATSRDTNINGNAYRVFTNSAAGNEYYLKNNNDYSEFLNITLLNDLQFENLYLRADAAAGNSWSQTIPPITTSGITANLAKFDTLLEKGLTKTVKGKTYTDVIHVASAIRMTSISVPIVPLNSLQSSVHNYYAPGVGRILSTNYFKLTIPTLIDETIQNKIELISTNF
jgi:hypothetical protein